MEEKLTREEVLHVAHLARNGLTEEEIKKFQVQLKTLLNEVEKINEVKGYDDEMIFTPREKTTSLRKDEVGEMLTAEEALKNVPERNGNFVEVPVMIDE